MWKIAAVSMFSIWSVTGFAGEYGGETGALVYGSFDDDYLLDGETADSVVMEGSDREVQPGVVYFETMNLVFAWKYEDLTFENEVTQRITMRCSVKDYSLKRCALILNADVFMMLTADSLTELNANIGYTQLYGRVENYAGHKWSNTSLYPFGVGVWNRVDTVQFAYYPSAGYKIVRVKGFGKWTLKKELLSDIISVLEPRMKDSVKETTDFVYAVSVAKQDNVCVRYLPSGECQIRTNIYTRAAANTLEVSKERSDGMPFSLRMVLSFDSRYDQSQHLDFSQTLTTEQIIE
jgi:hypothetical protein